MSGKSGITWGSVGLIAVAAIFIDDLITKAIDFISSNLWTIVVIALIIVVLFYMLFIGENSAPPPNNEPPSDYF